MSRYVISVAFVSVIMLLLVSSEYTSDVIGYHGRPKH